MSGWWAVTEPHTPVGDVCVPLVPSRARSSFARGSQNTCMGRVAASFRHCWVHLHAPLWTHSHEGAQHNSPTHTPAHTHSHFQPATQPPSHVLGPKCLRSGGTGTTSESVPRRYGCTPPTVQQLPALLCSHCRAPPCTHFFQFGTALLLQLPAMPNTRATTELSLFCISVPRTC